MARPEKVATVDEIKGKITASGAAVLTEYRGLSVTDLARLRATLRDSGTTYKIYKNTLARRAVAAAELGELTDLLIGPTAWAFVDGDDVVGAAKALRDFARTNEALVIKGGLLEGRVISAEQVAQIALLASRDQLLAQIAGVFQAPVRKAATLFSALQRNTAYAIKALIDKRVEGGEELPGEPEAEAEASEGPPEESEAEADPAAEATAEQPDEEPDEEPEQEPEE